MDYITLESDNFLLLKMYNHEQLEQLSMVEYNDWDLARTSTSALTAWSRELAYAAADLNSSNFHKKVSFGMASANTCAEVSSDTGWK